MSTASVVDEIILKAPNWNRDGSRSVLEMMNRAQNYLFSKPCLLSTYVDPSTGDYPYLATTSGVFDYEIPDVTVTIDDDIGPASLRIHNVHRVFTDNPMINDYGIASVSPYMTKMGSEVRWSFTPKPATQIKRARVTLPFDPGTTTSQYKILAVLEPQQLTSDSISFMVQLDDEEFIIEGALGWIEYFDYGRSDRLDRFKQQLAREFWNKYQGVNTIRKQISTPRRKF